MANGNGGGFIGGARRTSNSWSGRKHGSGPPNTNGRGQGGFMYGGGAGAGHGKLIYLLYLTNIESCSDSLFCCTFVIIIQFRWRWRPRRMAI